MKTCKQPPTALRWLCLLLLLLSGGALHAQSYEEPPTVTILTHTNRHYRHLDGTQDWVFDGRHPQRPGIYSRP